MSRPESFIAWDLAISFKQVGVGFRVKSLGFDPKTLQPSLSSPEPPKWYPCFGDYNKQEP